MDKEYQSQDQMIADFKAAFPEFFSIANHRDAKKIRLDIKDLLMHNKMDFDEETSNALFKKLSSPNSHIHQLSNMSSSNGMDAKRRILVFWLVNPDVPIVSTAHVEPQQNTMSFEEAKKHQLSLMHERKTHKEDFSEREVFLCEH
jgi:hypothetical protein